MLKTTIDCKKRDNTSFGNKPTHNNNLPTQILKTVMNSNTNQHKFWNDSSLKNMECIPTWLAYYARAWQRKVEDARYQSWKERSLLVQKQGPGAMSGRTHLCKLSTLLDMHETSTNKKLGNTASNKLPTWILKALWSWTNTPESARHDEARNCRNEILPLTLFWHGLVDLWLPCPALIWHGLIDLPYIRLVCSPDCDWLV